MTKKKYLFLDFSNFAHRMIHGAISEIKKNGAMTQSLINNTDIEMEDTPTAIWDDEDVYELWKNRLLNSIFRAIENFRPDEVIIAYDSRNYWRKEIFPPYKIKDLDARKADIDWNGFYEMEYKFIADFKETFINFKHMEVERCEADDIIGVLTNEFAKEADVIIVSSDKDFIQLKKNENVTLYNPLKEEEVISVNPSKDLEIKIIVGDKSDKIPQLKARVGDKTASKIIDNGLHEWLEEEGLEEDYERNKSLIDLTLVPFEYQNEIAKHYLESEPTMLKFDEPLRDFIEIHKISEMLTDTIRTKYLDLIKFKNSRRTRRRG